ncbi:WSC domain-containing protein [Rhypophila decipiens]|uniref:WSC domain-containing protein n=1 Tax=Rhypophila decipiens TaxID=261697 RepID=A0AAN7B861_9PEZI|nr:WSC domain-containing protein [Rhypophila decipiens]
MQRLTLVSYAVASALVAPLVSASPVGVLTRRNPAFISGYEYTGCYTEAHNGRALTGSAFFDDQLTAEKCATACSGFKYFGLEYGRECYCGDSINQGSIETAAEECSFSCPGNSAETCGAGGRLTLYTGNSAASAPSLPSTYRALGCHSEPTGGRALSAKVTRADDMTIQKCADICRASNFLVFGLEYYTECYCGNGLAPGSAPAPETDCSFPCAGNSNELCGGDWRINVFEFSTDTTASTTTAPSTPTPTPSLHGWVREGCYTEANGQRALSDVSFYNDAMSLEKCAAVCHGYAWFGVEYGRECYCGNTLNKGSVPAAPAECNFPCPGKLSQTCGAGNRLSLYSAEDDVATSSTTVPTSTSAPGTTTTSSPAQTSTSALSTTTTSTISTTSSSSTSAGPTTSTTSTTRTTSTTSTTSSTLSTTTTSATAPSSTPNLLVNGDFEGDASAWTILNQSPNNNLFSYNLASTTVVHGGQRSAEFTWAAGAPSNTFTFSIRTQQINPARNVLYKVTGFHKSSGANPFLCSLTIFLETQLGATQFFTVRTGVVTQWTQFATSGFALSNNAQFLRIRVDAKCSTTVIGTFNPAFSINIDDLALEMA